MTREHAIISNVQNSVGNDSENMQKDAVPTLFLSGLKCIFGKSGHSILLTWIRTLLLNRAQD